MKTIGIYNPYLETKGGGEKMALALAEILSNDKNHEVTLDRPPLLIEGVVSQSPGLRGVDLPRRGCINVSYRAMQPFGVNDPLPFHPG